MRFVLVVSSCLLGLISAREIPASLKAFYDAHKNTPCANPISGKYKSHDGSPADTVYCKDVASGTIFHKGPIKQGGYADMDIDCDGSNMKGGACDVDGSGQDITAFQDQLPKYGIHDLDAHIHTYVVLGNDGPPKFDPQDHNIQPLSVVAVVCNNQLYYGIFGDTNGVTSVGEASLALGQMCFPDDHITGNNGHGPNDVLFLAFPGEDAVPKEKANWKAKSKEEFEESLASVGEKLIASLGNATVHGAGASPRSRVMRAML